MSSLGLPQEIADRRKLVGLFHSMSFQSSIALEDKNNGKNRQGYLLRVRERERVKWLTLRWLAWGDIAKSSMRNEMRLEIFSWSCATVYDLTTPSTYKEFTIPQKTPHLSIPQYSRVVMYELPLQVHACSNTETPSFPHKVFCSFKRTVPHGCVGWLGHVVWGTWT